MMTDYEQAAIRTEQEYLSIFKSTCATDHKLMNRQTCAILVVGAALCGSILFSTWLLVGAWMMPIVDETKPVYDPLGASGFQETFQGASPPPLSLCKGSFAKCRNMAI